MTLRTVAYHRVLTHTPDFPFDPDVTNAAPEWHNVNLTEGFLATASAVFEFAWGSVKTELRRSVFGLACQNDLF